MRHHNKHTAPDYTSLREMLYNSNPVDIAEKFEELDEEQVIRVFRMLPKDTAAEVFAYLHRDMQQDIINSIQDYEISHIVDELFLDDAVDFIEEMPAGVVKRVLSNLPVEKRDIINTFLQYQEDTAGSIMTIEYVDLKENLTVEETFKRIRHVGVEKETIYTCYVIDAERRLIGVVSVKALLLASPKNKISDIMERDVIFASTGDDVESLANEFRKYDLLAMPIVDNEQRLVGIVTVDDMLDVQVEEATDDFEIMAAMSPSDEPYLKTSVWVLVKNRLPWLVILMLTATITGLILESFENAMAVIPILITFIPMLMDTGGSGGAQSSTLIIRGLALEEIRLRDILKVLWRELRVALLCGFALAIVNFIRIFIMYARHEVVGSFVGELGITVSFALWITVVVAKIVGCMLPLGAKLLKLDPAVMAAPVITTIVDACGLLVFFGIAKAIFAL